MARLQFPSFKRSKIEIQNINEIYSQSLSFGERTADMVANIVGSWKFIIIQGMILLAWIIMNSLVLIFQWDPYPFILMNLFLSAQAAFTAPIIMMSQNRQAAKDRIETHQDYLLDKKAAEDIEHILTQLEAQNLAMQEMYQLLSDIKNKAEQE